jgi:hypothetical protein
MHLARLVRGAVAGTAATAPMTYVLRTIHRRLPPHERYALPPEELPATLAVRAGAPPAVHSEIRERAWLPAHYAYGAAAGTLYAALVPRPTAANGLAFGLALWAASYLGWVPALGLPQGAPDEPPRRNGMMIAGHLVWGLAAARALQGR